MITSNAKLYDELIKNPSIIEFDYSFSQLTDVLKFEEHQVSFYTVIRASILYAVLKLVSNILGTIQSIFKSSMIKVEDFWWAIPDDELKTKIKEVNHVGLVVIGYDLDLFNHFSELIQYIEFCHEIGVPKLSVFFIVNHAAATDEEGKQIHGDLTFLDAVKLCLKAHNMLGKEDVKIELGLIDKDDDVKEKVVFCNGFEDQTVDLKLNFKYIQRDQVLSQKVDALMTYDKSVIESKIGISPEGIAKVKYLEDLTVTRFLKDFVFD